MKITDLPEKTITLTERQFANALKKAMLYFQIEYGIDWPENENEGKALERAMTEYARRFKEEVK